MNSLDIPLNQFHVEQLSLDEFKKITIYGNNNELISNIIMERYENGADIKIIGYEIIKDDIYFFLRWL